MGLSDELAKLEALRQRGVLTEQACSQAKARLLPGPTAFRCACRVCYVRQRPDESLAALQALPGPSWRERCPGPGISALNRGWRPDGSGYRTRLSKEQMP